MVTAATPLTTTTLLSGNTLYIRSFPHAAKRPLGNGVATIELTPMALLRRLASIVPPSGSHDTSYFGVFAAHSKWRRQLARPRRKDPEDCQTHPRLRSATDRWWR
jgi:hypothetical protein